MFAEETCAWFSVGGVDADGFACEMPFGWAPYPAGMIGGGQFPGHEVPPTVLVRGSAEANPQVGNGLLLSMRVPADQGDDPEELANQLNLLDSRIPGAAHPLRTARGFACICKSKPRTPQETGLAGTG